MGKLIRAGGPAELGRLAATADGETRLVGAPSQTEFGRFVGDLPDRIGGHMCNALSETNRRRIARVPQGGCWKDIPPELLPDRFRRVRLTDYATLYGRLHAASPSYTISAGFGNVQDPARSGAKRPRSVEQIGRDLFGDDDRQAVRGLLAMRAIPDLPPSVLPKEMAPKRSEVQSLPGFRMHGFVRNIEGMFASIDLDAEGAVVWGAPSIERGQDYDGETGIEGRRRLFEMLYCEACGDLYLGGKRGGSSPSSRLVSLLPAPQELEQLPESSISLRFEDTSYREFALFWPGRGEPESEIRVEKSPYCWNVGWLDPRTGVVSADEVHGGVPGRLAS